MRPYEALPSGNGSPLPLAQGGREAGGVGRFQTTPPSPRTITHGGHNSLPPRGQRSEPQMNPTLPTTTPPTLPPGGPWSPPYRLLTLGIVLTITGAAFEALAVATTL